MMLIQTIFISLSIAILASCAQPSVTISYDESSRQERYAAKMLSQSLKTAGYTLTGENGKYSVDFLINKAVLLPEAFSIVTQGKTIVITGGDERGLIYGALSLAEDIRNGVNICKTVARNEQSRLVLRAVKYDLPWDSYRHSEALHLHDLTCRDTTYWNAFLDMMVENRLNSLTLWNLHSFPFLIVSHDFPEANPWTEEEAIEWQKLFRAIFRMAKDRAIDTYIFPFNIFVTKEFATAHNVAMDNLDHYHYNWHGETTPIVIEYTRSCVTQVLEEYPDMTGFGITLGEGMGEMTPQEREEWITATYIEGMRQANRKSKLVYRAPLSGTTGSSGRTSIEAERITRTSIERIYEMGFTDGLIFIDLKFNWSHAHSTSRLIKVHSGKLYDAFFNPVSDKYKMTWTARNEDFFCLRWGVPEFVRDHVKINSPPYVGGYFIGSETYIPAKDYFTADTSGNPRYAFERQWLFYKIWGRLLYNYDTPDEVFHNEFIYRYGSKGKKLLEASSLAGKTPLRFASNFDCTWDFTLYSEGMMALNNRNRGSVNYISIDQLINQPPLDTTFVNIREYVKVLSEGGTFESERTTPKMLADMLDKDCTRALRLVKNIKPVANDHRDLIYELADIRAWSYLGLHYAEKLRAAVALYTARTTGNEDKRAEAIAHLEKGLSYWDELVAITRPLYKDMPLTHLQGWGGGDRDGSRWWEYDHLRFHWAIIRPDVAKDLELAEN